MIKDIDIPKSQDVALAITKNKDFYEIHLVNKKNEAINNVLLLINATKDNKKTSTLRRQIPLLEANKGIKVENMLPEVLLFKSTYSITYFSGDKLFDLKIEIENPSFSKIENISQIEAQGILIWP